METIVNKHIYYVNYSFLDLKSKKPNSCKQIYPILLDEYIDPRVLELDLIGKQAFRKTAEGLIKRPYYEKLGYSASYFKYLNTEVSYSGYENWWLIWFSHESLSDFRNSEEAYRDFENFLYRRGIKILEEGNEEDGSCSSYTKGGYASMFAERKVEWEIKVYNNSEGQKITRIMH